MIGVLPPSRADAPAVSRRVRASAVGFMLPMSPPAPEAAGAGPVTATGLLALQEQAAPPPAAAAREREARRHGRAMLDALRDLQRAILSGAGERACLDHLAALLAARPESGAPESADVLDEVALRVAVELARREVAADGMTRT